MPEATRFKMLLSKSLLPFTQRERETEMVRWGKVRRPSVCRARFAFVFLRVFLFIEFLSRNILRGVWKVFFYLFKRYLFLIFLESSAKVGANHAAKVTPPLSPLEYEYDITDISCAMSD
jgi:hypothetical protein